MTVECSLNHVTLGLGDPVTLQKSFADSFMLTVKDFVVYVIFGDPKKQKLKKNIIVKETFHCYYIIIIFVVKKF